MNILVILLGCHISLLLNDRVTTAVKHIFDLSAETSMPITVNWYLSGGVKNPSVGKIAISEAENMQNQISSILYDMYNCSVNLKFDFNNENNCLIKSNFILDKKATNTAENFIIANNHIATNKNKYSDIYVVTSDWHYKRAKYISELSIPNNNFEWILSEKHYENFAQMEHIHMRNVKSDVTSALHKLNLNI